VRILKIVALTNSLEQNLPDRRFLPVRVFPALYGRQRLIVMFVRKANCMCPEPDKSSSLHLSSSRYILILLSHLDPDLRHGTFPFRSPTKNSSRVSLLSKFATKLPRHPLRLVQGDSLARGPELLSIKNYNFEIMT